MPQATNQPPALNELDVTEIYQVDAILRSMTKTRRDCDKNSTFINFWLDIRLSLMLKGGELLTV